MDLSRMQDIAGIRLVLNTTCSPEQGLRDIDTLFQHCLAVLTSQNYKIRDKVFHYVNSPKESGYRAIHFVVESATGHPDFSILPIEVQLRTKCQHLWAMAVETVDMVYSQSLKSSEGSEEWATFFKMCSAAISHLEAGTVHPQYADYSTAKLKSELTQYATERTFFQKMSNIKVVDDIIRREDPDLAYCLLELNLKQGKTKAYGFLHNQSQLANAIYTKLEQSTACLQGDAYVVLISVDHVKNIQTLYPSYFLDVSDFMSKIREFLA